MSAVAKQSVTTPPTTPRSTARARWALLAALVVGLVGGAGLSAGVVHGQVRTVHDVRTVVVAVPSDSEPPAVGPGSPLCRAGHRC
jgi:hypothetical protein